MLWFYVTYAKPHALYLVTQCSVSTSLVAIGDVMRMLRGKGKHGHGAVGAGRDLSFLDVFDDADGGNGGNGGDEDDTHNNDDLQGTQAEDGGGGGGGANTNTNSKGGSHKNSKDLVKENRVQFLRSLLRMASVSLPGRAQGGFTIPLGHHTQVKGILASSSRVMSSKQAPLWVVFQNLDGPSAPQAKVPTLFKQGDDLRQDFLTLQALTHMQVSRHELVSVQCSSASVQQASVQLWRACVVFLRVCVWCVHAVWARSRGKVWFLAFWVRSACYAISLLGWRQCRT
jgi:hypothetical protein